MTRNAGLYKTSKRGGDPLFDDGVQGWMLQYAKRHFWRVPSYYTFDDLLQDGRMLFALLRREYPEVMTDPQMMMGRFKRMYSNWITDLANERTPLTRRQNPDGTIRAHEDPMRLMPEVPFSHIKPDNQTEERMLEGMLGTEPPMGGFIHAMITAPRELKDLVELFLSDLGSAKIQEPLKRYDNGTRETINERLCGLLGKDPKQINLSRMFKVHFMNEPPPTWEGFLVATARAAHQTLERSGMVEQA